MFGFLDFQGCIANASFIFYNLRNSDYIRMFYAEVGIRIRVFLAFGRAQDFNTQIRIQNS